MNGKVYSYAIITPEIKEDYFGIRYIKQDLIVKASEEAFKFGMKSFNMKVDLVETSSKSLKELESIHGELRSDASFLKDRNLDYLQVIIEGEVDSIKCFECGYIFGIKNASPSCVKKKMCIQCLQKHYN